MKAKLLDATVLIDLRRAWKTKSGPVLEWFKDQSGPFFVNAVSVGEFLEGEADTEEAIRWLRQFERPFLPITQRTSFVMATLQRQRPRSKLGENDAWMAASAMEHGLHLLTTDKGFGGVRGLTWSRYPKT